MRYFIATDFLLVVLVVSEYEAVKQPDSELNSTVNSQSSEFKFSVKWKEELSDLKIIERTTTDISKITRPSTQRLTRAGPVYRRRQILEEDLIFPRKNIKDPYSPDLFNEFTGLNAKRVSRRSAEKLHKFIKQSNFRGFIREMNVYVRKIPFKQLFQNHDENADGLFHRVAFYLLLRVFGFEPTDYFDDLWKKYGVLTVETTATVLLFAVDLGVNVESDYNVTMNIVDGSETLLPRDTKTILCAGISFDKEFDCKIRHWKAVLRDKTNVTKTER